MVHWIGKLAVLSGQVINHNKNHKSRQEASGKRKNDYLQISSRVWKLSPSYRLGVFAPVKFRMSMIACTTTLWLLLRENSVYWAHVTKSDKAVYLENQMNYFDTCTSYDSSSKKGSCKHGIFCVHVNTFTVIFLSEGKKRHFIQLPNRWSYADESSLSATQS